MADRVNCAVLGLGGMGLVYCRALQRAQNARLTCASDPHEPARQRAASEFTVPVYPDYHHLLSRPDVDAVVIATPNNVHAEQTVAALDGGKHVLCTKPMATSLKQADEMIAASKRTGLKVEIGFNRRFDAPIQRVKQLLEAGTIGRVFYAKCSALSMRPREGFAIPGRPPADVYWKWYGRRHEAGGGCLMTHNSHELDYIQWFFGEVDWLLGKKDTVFQQIEVEDLAAAIIQFKTGPLVAFDSSTSIIATKAPTVEIFGEEGVISLGRSQSKDPSVRTPSPFPDSAGETTYPDQLLTCTRAGEWRVVMRGYTDWFEQQVLELEQFCGCILSDTPPMIPAEEGRKSLELVLAITRSSESGQRVFLPLER